MTTETIVESGMSFGPFSEGYCFYIEKSQTLKEINKLEGIRIAEFLLLKIEDNRTVVTIIEAKTSSPKPKSHDDYDRYIYEIKEKLANTLALFVSFYLQRYPVGHSELPVYFQETKVGSIHFELILVVKNSKSEWLIPLSDDLKKALKPTIKIWNLSPTSVKVFNEEEARVKKLVI